MSCQHISAQEWTAAFLLAVSLFAGSLVPFLLLVDADHLTPRWLRNAPAASGRAIREAALTAAALLLLLTAPSGGTR
jgi:hypothetical protein